MKEWKWEKAPGWERGEMVRSHRSGTRPLTNEQLCHLFCLTPQGCSEILAGQPWKPEYSIGNGSMERGREGQEEKAHSHRSSNGVGERYMIPKKRTRPKMGLRKEPQIRSLRHLRYIRSLNCAIMGKLWHVCRPPIQAAHIRVGTDGGTGKKPSDIFTIPLCVEAHIEQGRGERTFEKKYGLDTLKMADALWQKDVASRMEWKRKRDR